MNSIRRRLTRDILAGVFVLLTAGMAALCWVAYSGALNLFDDMLEARAESIVALTHRENGRIVVGLNEAMRRSFSGTDYPDSLYFQVWDEDGRVVLRSPSLDDGERLPRRTGPVDDPEHWDLTLPDGNRGRAIGLRFRPLDLATERPAREDVYLVVAADREDLDETLWNMVALSLGWSGLLVVATLAVFPPLLHRGLRPLERLGAEAVGIDARSLDSRFGTEGIPRELRPIVERLNALLERLQQSFERERRFSADLAHELRTPLAELRSTVESALKWPEQRDPQTDQDVLAVAMQMERIVGHILALARGESGQLALRLESVETAALLRRVVGPFARRAVARELQLNLPDDGTQAWAVADAALLQAVLTNLVENAIEYAPVGTEISLRVGPEGGRMMIAVANAAPDLTDADVGRLFERFWRKEAARSGGGRHLGLGLSLSRAFAESMAWSLTAARDSAGRLTLSLTGPAAESLTPPPPLPRSE